MEYTLIKGGHKDLHRVFPMLEFDFREFERMPELRLHAALIRGSAELLLQKDEDGLETGYAVVYTKSLYRYALLSYIGVYPTFRGRGAARALLRDVKARYAGRQGLLLEVTDTPGEDKGERLRAFYASQGFETVPCGYFIGGEPGTLMCLPLLSGADVSFAAPEIIHDIFSGIVPEDKAEEYARAVRI